jgi:hypothetical protein
MFQHVVRVVLVATSISLTAGCYRYAPVDAPGPAAGSEIRVRLTDEGAIKLGPLVGNRIEYVDGRVVSAADTALTVSVSGTTDRIGVEVSWRGEEVVLPRVAISGLERRTLDKRRSYVAGGIAAGIVAAVGIGFNIAGNGGGPRTGSPGTPR